MEELDREGRLHFPKKPKEGPNKEILGRNARSALHKLWDDIPPINVTADERLGYPTQKPEALLERIIATSSDEGDIVLDPFCGCGTAVAAAQKPQAPLDRHRHHPPRDRPD